MDTKLTDEPELNCTVGLDEIVCVNKTTATNNVAEELNICGGSSLETNLKRHTEVRRDGRLLKCEMCKKTFRYASRLREHEMIHSRKRPHECNVCKKKNAQFKSSTRHKVTHFGKRLHKCEICERRRFKET